ncbi:MAG: FliH/SctL family protein [Fibrobacterota bacterium]
MQQENDDTSHLIDELMKRKDPALVGIKRILKRKQAKNGSGAFSSHIPEVFSSHPDEVPVQPSDESGFEGHSSARVSVEEDDLFDRSEKQILADEKRILELEKQVKSLQSQLEEERAAAYDEGEAAGRKAAKEQHDRDMEEQIASLREEFSLQLSNALSSQLADREEHIRSFQRDVVDLSVIIAEKIIDRAAEFDRDMVNRAVNKALGFIAGKSAIEIRVASGDYPVVSRRIEEIKQRRDTILDVSVSSSDAVSPGGCLVETDTGVIDVTRESRLRAVRSIISDAFLDSGDDSSDDTFSHE